MFVRVKSTPNSPRKVVQIVEGKRIGTGVKQTIIAHVGVIFNQDEEIKLKALAREMMVDIIKKRAAETNLELSDTDIQKLMKRGRRSKDLIAAPNIPNSGIVFDHMEEEYRLVDGVDDIVSGVFNNLGFSNLLKSAKQNQLLKDVTLTRMVYPQSKLQLCATMQDKFDKRYNEDQIYRMMDNLYPKINRIKQLVFNKAHALMPDINVLLFDVTTLYCESIMQDGLREFGFSKDGKFNNTQLVLALATNELGLPIGYEVFPGNCAEVKTLLSAINKWSELFNIKNACFIGDRAMFSEDNINLIEEHGYQYIIAAKLRGMPRELQQQILNEDNYKTIEFGEESGRIAEFNYPDKVQHVRCILGDPGSDNTYGYIVTGTKGNITSIQYIAPDNKINIAVNESVFQRLCPELNKLRCYTSRCKCVIMTEDEYKLFLDNPEMLADVAIIVGREVIYNGQKVSITILNDKQQEHLISTLSKSKISNSIMRELFKEHYTCKTYVNIPYTILMQLFPDYKIPERRLCVSYKPSRASNDAYKRTRILERLKDKQGSSTKVVKTVARMYMTTTGDTILDEIKIAEAEKWDGIHGVITNITADKPQEILSRYSNLWRIEEAFRINKHNLRMRPIYHYKPERIHTHLAMCYMTFTLLKLIQYQTQLTQPRFVINNILSTLLSVQSSIYVDSKTMIRYRMPGCLSNDAKILYQAFGIKRAKQLTVYER